MDATEETFLNQPSAFADGLRFPLRLHVLLEESDKRGQSSIVSWIHNGTAFKVHDRLGAKKATFIQRFDCNQKSNAIAQ